MNSEKRLEKRLEEITKEWEETRDIERKEKKKIHDPVHGTIVLEGYLVALLDLPLVQRLREIKQLGPAERLYPGANHTRFEHTLGVYSAANSILRKLDEEGETEITDTQRMEVKAAALLHDIGHLPFSHMSERFLEEYTDITEDSDVPASDIHELIGYKLLQTDYVEDHIQRINREYGIGLQIDRIRNIIVRNIDSQSYAFLTDIIHGPLDADRIDYLLRDSYKVGLPTVIDSDRLLETLTLIEDHESPEKHRRLGIQRKGTEAAESLFVARDRLKPIIHNHHVTLVAENMILREIISSYKDNPMELVGVTDHELFARLMENESPRFTRYRERKFPKRYQYFTIKSKGKKGNKDAKKKIKDVDLKTIQQLEEELSEYLDEPLVIINEPEQFDRSSIGDTIVEGKNGRPEELVIELNRSYKGKSVKTVKPEIQIHSHWKDASKNNIDEEAIKECISTSFSIDKSIITEAMEFSRNEYSEL